jgi:thiol:disulfide interchange protein DsbC
MERNVNKVVRSVLSFCCLSLFSLPVLAGETEIKKAVESVVRQDAAVVSIAKTPYGGLYEVVLNTGDIVYSDVNGGFMIAQGRLIDTKTRTDVTAARDRELSRINIAELPLSQAVRQVRGNGKRMLITFEDPNCVYCKKLATDLKEMKDVTIYTFMIPILAADSLDKSRNIWCASDRAKAWTDWMIDGKAAADAQCDNPIMKNAALARQYRVSGTPTIVFADGYRAGGYIAPAELERAVNDAGAKAKSASK